MSNQGTVVEQKQFFLQAKKHHLSRAINPSQQLKTTAEDGGIELSVVKAALDKVNRDLKQHSRKVYSRQMMDHIVQQIDELYWESGARDLDDEGVDEYPKKTAMRCTRTTTLPSTRTSRDCPPTGTHPPISHHLLPSTKTTTPPPLPACKTSRRSVCRCKRSSIRIARCLRCWSRIANRKRTYSRTWCGEMRRLRRSWRRRERWLYASRDE